MAVYLQSAWTGTNGSNCLQFYLMECSDGTYTTCSSALHLSYEELPFKCIGGGGEGAYNVLTNFYLSTDTPYQMLSNKYYYIYYYFGDLAWPSESFQTYGANTANASSVYPDVATCDDMSTACGFDFLYFKILNTSDVFQLASRVSRLYPRNGDLGLDQDTQFAGFYTNNQFDKLIINIYNRNLRTTENLLTLDASYGEGLPYVINSHLNNGNYSYTAYLYNTLTASSSISSLDTPYYFTIGTTTPFLPPYRVFDLSEESICAGVATSTFFGGIECGFKKVFAWAFYPDEQSITDFAISYGELKQVFPFNAFFDLTDTVSTAIASTTTNSAGGIQMPFINNSGDYTMLTVASSSSLPNLIGTSNNNLFRNTITYIFWALAGVLVFFTIKTI
jgi:hypothetical protein